VVVNYADDFSDIGENIIQHLFKVRFQDENIHL